MELITKPGKETTAPETLSGHAADIWTSAFNSAYGGTCKERDDREACAAKIAWSAVKESYKKENGEWVKKQEPSAEPVDTGADADGQVPVAVQPDRPVIPTPQNLTRAEAEVWNRTYLEAIESQCAQADNPQACAARQAWNAVAAFGEEVDTDREADIEVGEEDVDDETLGDEDDEEEETADGEEEDEPTAEAEEEPAEGEDEEEDEPTAESEEEPAEGEEAPPEEEDGEAEDDETEEEEESEDMSLSDVMAKVGAGERLGEQETKMLAAAVDAASEGESDEGKEVLDSIMRKVSNGEELSEQEKEILQAALKAAPEEKSMVVKSEDGAMRQKSYTEKQMRALISAGRALPDGRLPIVQKSDLPEAVKAVTQSGVADPDVVRHIIVRAGSMGALPMLPDEWLNKGTAVGIRQVSEDWLSATVERAISTMEDEAWLRRVGEDTKITRPDYVSSFEWASLPAVEKTAKAEYLRQFVRRMYEQAVDDMEVMGWQSEPMPGKDYEFAFKRWIEHEEGPLLQRAILIRKMGTRDWKIREIGRGASLSNAIKTLPDEVRP